MHASPGSGLHYLWHPGTRDRFSGYGLIIAPWRLVGMIMVDRPTVADLTWLEEIERTFGRYQLAAMTQTGERGMLCRLCEAIVQFALHGDVIIFEITANDQRFKPRHYRAADQCLNNEGKRARDQHCGQLIFVEG